METTLANLNRGFGSLGIDDGNVIAVGYANPTFQFVIFDVNPSAVRVTGSVNAGSTFACNDVPVMVDEPGRSRPVWNQR